MADDQYAPSSEREGFSTRRGSPTPGIAVRSVEGIELRHLRFALLAAELSSFAKAAARLRIKQATLSRHISYLERRFGTTLFRRSPRGVVPTEAGIVFLNSARRVLDEMDGLLAATRAVGLGTAGTLSVGFMSSLSAGNLRSSLLAFFEERPAIDVRGVEDERHRLLGRLETGNLDLLIVSGSIDRSDLKQLALWSERMFVALPSDHPCVDGSPLARVFEQSTWWSVRPCVRPLMRPFHRRWP